MRRSIRTGWVTGLAVGAVAYLAVAPFDCKKVDAYTRCSGWIAHEYSIAGTARPPQWQAIGTGLILGLLAGLISWAIRSDAESSMPRNVLRVALLLATLLSLAGIYSYGAYTSPVLLVPLWFAARSGGSIERWVWIGLAAPCAWITGWLISYSTESDQMALVLALSMVAVFAATAKRNRVPD